MNLHGIASRYVSKVNPLVQAELYVNMGWIEGRGAKRIAQWAPPIIRTMQIQALDSSDTTHNDEMNTSISTHRIYVYGVLNDLTRANQLGGDKIQILTGRQAGAVFLVTSILEQWPDWVCALATLQTVP